PVPLAQPDHDERRHVHAAERSEVALPGPHRPTEPRHGRRHHRLPADRHRAARVPAPPRPGPHVGRGQGMRRARVGAVAACLAGAVLAACGNGGSILDAGNDLTTPTTTTTVTLPPVTAAPGKTLPPTTPPTI